MPWRENRRAVEVRTRFSATLNVADQAVGDAVLGHVADAGVEALA